METRFHLNKPNPKSSANFLSKLFFGWTLQIFQAGNKHELQIQDLFQPLKADESELLGNELEKNWEHEKIRAKGQNCTPNLFIALKNTFFHSYMMYGIIIFFRFCFIRASQPIILAKLLALFSDNSEKNVSNHDRMVFYGTILVGQTIIGLFIDNHVLLELARIGLRVRVACSSLVYRKVLKLNKKSVNQLASGQILNLLSNDVNRFDAIACLGHHLWITPIQTVIIVYLIYEKVNISAFAGLVAMFMLTVPINVPMGNLIAIFRKKVANKTDYRVRLMNEVINGIHVIKMYAWEKPFQYIVKKARGKEIDYITKVSYIKGVFLSCMVYSERAASTSTILCYLLLGNVITADKAYSVVQYFCILQVSMAVLCPLAVAFGSETYVTVKRLENFLLLEEKDQLPINECRDKSLAIEMENITAAWTENKDTLNNISLKIPKGALVAVIGPVGAGKSSLLQIILGELIPKNSGRIFLNGQISYAAQEPWLFASTVRHNILFGQLYNQQRYKRVTEACALKVDLQQFPLGDLSMVGERGVSLSGGQRARINLARAVYRQADIYILEDPLSAVDAHVGKHLFEECILKYLENKTRILVTHQLQYLRKADLIVVINEGKIEAQGTFEQLSKNQMDFTKLLIAAGEQQEDNVYKIKKRKSHLYNKNMCKRFIGDTETDNQMEEFGGNSAANTTFLEYFKAGGNRWILLGLCCILVLGQGASSGSDYWMQFWVNKVARKPSRDDVQLRNIKYFDKIDASISLDSIVYVSMLFTAFIITITLIRSILFYIICMAASKNLHHKMFESLLKAPIAFFTTNTTGRVLNRFSRDIGTIDEDLPTLLLEAVQILLIVCGIVVTISVLNYYMIGAIALLGFVFWKLRSLFVPTAKEVKRLEAIARSPVFSHITASLNGLTTIRVSKCQTLLMQEFDAHQDVRTSASYISMTLSGAFGLWMDLFCALFMASVTFSFILIDLTGTISASAVGLAISQSILLMGLLQQGLRITGEMVSQMTSVERILQYTNIDKEGPFDTLEDNKIASHWPQEGSIQFSNLSLKYNKNDAPALKQLNVEISSGQKIGIVGRTGSGKSSIIAALFRLAPIDGKITIDGIDTQSIGLSDLRKRISIIPQEPILFSASIRYNLDVFDEFSEEVLWKALEEVELKQSIPSLDFMIEEGGSNLSVGQRQLICLARAILKNNRILILDEATANVDPRTDALIQETIRRKFSSSTVLTIAHRLNTIMDSDRILVMDNGYIIEFEHPYNLLRNKQGYFTKMVAESGATVAAQYQKVALQSYQRLAKIS